MLRRDTLHAFNDDLANKILKYDFYFEGKIAEVNKDHLSISFINKLSDGKIVTIGKLKNDKYCIRVGTSKSGIELYTMSDLGTVYSLLITQNDNIVVGMNKKIRIYSFHYYEYRFTEFDTGETVTFLHEMKNGFLIYGSCNLYLWDGSKEHFLANGLIDTVLNLPDGHVMMTLNRRLLMFSPLGKSTYNIPFNAKNVTLLRLHSNEEVIFVLNSNSIIYAGNNIVEFKEYYIFDIKIISDLIYIILSDDSIHVTDLNTRETHCVYRSNNLPIFIDSLPDDSCVLMDSENIVILRDLEVCKLPHQCTLPMMISKYNRIVCTNKNGDLIFYQ